MAVTVWHPSAKRQQLEDAGPFTRRRAQVPVHTTEGPSLEGAFVTVKGNRSAPHFILEVKSGRRRLVQCIPINRAARGLEHNGGPETNKANCIQVEVVGFTERAKAAKLGHLELWVPNWSTDIYKQLHMLMLWTHNHFSSTDESRPSLRWPTRIRPALRADLLQRRRPRGSLPCSG